MTFNRFGISFCATHAYGWFRIFGVGVSWKDTRMYPLIFSQRNGYARGRVIGNWWVGWWWV
jgi:hypothetical protein